MPEAWLDGMCNYTGPGFDLPVGGYSKIPGWGPEKLANSWSVLDAESEEGFVSKRTADLKADDIIIGVNFNPKSIAKIVEMYGKNFYTIMDANGGPLMTFDEWQTKFGTNGMGLVAIRNMRRKLTGGGIRF